jgi:DNA-binding transcriptional LysR family regulator
MDYTLKQLSVFMTVAKLESTTAAARELSLSQSAVSSAIQQLESQIGQKLFDRIGRQLKLNRVGASLLPAVTELLAHAERLNLQLKGETIAGTVCIGASYTIANHIIVDTMVDFQKEHANVDIEINSDNSPGIIDSVIEGNVDFGLIESSVDDPRVLVEAWLQDELVVFASPDHPLVRQGRASVLELERAAWVLRELGSGARSVFNDTFRGALASLQIAMEFRHNEPIKRAVAKGVGVGCLSARVLERELIDGTLVALKTPEARKMPRRLAMIRRRDGVLSAPAQAFWQQCLAMR